MDKAFADKLLAASLDKEHLAQFLAIEARALATPPGRWHWDIRPQTKSVTLMGGESGWDTIITSHRWGMNGATFWMPNTENPSFLQGLEEDGVPHPGRAHHKDWALTTERPIAVFLAHSRADNDYLRDLVRSLAQELALVSGVEVGEEVPGG
ncbi:MAG TPA: hypothetical protein VF630_09015 [Hymenobacter sp.]